ncbi:hypothetical protein P5673_033163 [Acropora cervicornis]|uniref:Uncharacterized protein n=1 Tax=Acropora cervicornis TaxID=6130 RepID=A0AAD9URG3_ACRCE|nr:hypothetical protein P5673_033163 [Acropora cervicornis]
MAASVSTANSRSGEGVVICVSKAIDESDKSLLYVSKLEDEQIGEGYKPKVISVEEEMVEIMNADGNYVNCPGEVTFDTGNCGGTAISRELVKELNLEDTIDHENKVRFWGVARDDDDKQISNLCSTIEINIKIRKKEFPVRALYGVPAEGTDLLIGMDIIKKLFDEDFTLGK